MKEIQEEKERKREREREREKERERKREREKERKREREKERKREREKERKREMTYQDMLQILQSHNLVSGNAFLSCLLFSSELINDGTFTVC